MRKNYPMFSSEVNDIFQEAYYNLTYLLGYSDNNIKIYMGLYDEIESKIYELYKKLLSNNAQVTYINLYKTWGRLIVINELRSY